MISAWGNQVYITSTLQDGFAAPEDGEVPMPSNGEGEELEEYWIDGWNLIRKRKAIISFNGFYHIYYDGMKI